MLEAAGLPGLRGPIAQSHGPEVSWNGRPDHPITARSSMKRLRTTVRPSGERSERKSYAGIWVTGRLGGVVDLHLDDLDTVLESDSFDEFRQLVLTL